jgi:hypothetical protein
MLASDDDRLLAELRRILTTVDAVPGRVLLDARSAFGSRRGPADQDNRGAPSGDQPD